MNSSFTQKTSVDRQAKIIECLNDDWTEDEICEKLSCTLAEISVVRGRFMINYDLENGQRKRKTIDAANYHVISVLSKEQSARLMKPKVTEFDFVDANGRKRTLSIKK